MAETLASRQLRRHSEMAARRAPLEPLWQEAAARILPVQADIAGPREPRDRVRMDRTFDATAMLALGKFAAAVEAIVTPRNATWHSLVPSDPALAEDAAVARWCGQVRDILFALRARKRANFASASHEVYRMAGVFGHGPLFVQHDLGRGVRYMAVPVKEIWIDTDAAGMVDTVHRKYSLPLRRALEEFAADGPPRELAAMAEKDASRDKDIDILHCVFPNPDYNPERADARAMPYRSLHLWGARGEVLRDSGYRTMPYMVPRYETIPGCPYGFGPGLLMLPEISMVNEMGKSVIRAAHLATSPPLLLKDEDLLAPFSVAPDSLNWGGLDDQGRPAVRPLETGGRFDIGLELLNARQVVINDAFLVNLFRILVDQPRMTATEVLQRAGEKGELLAPTMGRLQAEFLAPLIERELDIMAAVPGLLPEMPPQLAEAGGLVSVEYSSPLAASMRSGEALGILRLLEALEPIARFDPGVLDVLDPDAAAKELAKAYNVPAAVLRSPEELAVLREHKTRERELAAVLSAAPAIAASAGKAAPGQAEGQPPARQGAAS